ncbi:MAG: crotonase/enoyl-CoA hydratase family protein [Rhodothalassiaceae bacterium]
MATRLRVVSGGAHALVRSESAAVQHVDDLGIPFPPMQELDLEYDRSFAALWCVQRHSERPNFTTSLIADIAGVQKAMKAGFEAAAPETPPVRYLIWASSKRNIFNLGGDLIHFVELLEAGDRDGMWDYARSCIEICHTNHVNLDLPVITIALAAGDALGGGLESALSSDLIIAERGAQFGFPEILFGLFPGMGAYSLVARRVGARIAERMIFSGRIYSAEDLYEMGLVHTLAEPGEGEQALHDYLKRADKRFHSHRSLFAARRVTNPVSFAEMEDIARRWVDTAMSLGKLELRKMQRLAKAQIARMERDGTAPDSETASKKAAARAQAAGVHSPRPPREPAAPQADVAARPVPLPPQSADGAAAPSPRSNEDNAMPRDAEHNSGILSRERDAAVIPVSSTAVPRSSGKAEGESGGSVYDLIIDGVAETRAAATLQPGVERLLSEGMSREEYLEFLEQLYHVVWHFCPTMAAAAAHCGEDRRALRYALYHNIDDEKGHETWVLDDIRALGGDVEAVVRGKPAIPVQAMIGYNYYAAERLNPWSVLGMVHVLEEISANYSGRVAKAVAERLGITDGAGFRFLSSHGTMDLHHVAGFRELVNQITDPHDYEAIIDAANVNYALFGALFKHA